MYVIKRKHTAVQVAEDTGIISVWNTASGACFRQSPAPEECRVDGFCADGNGISYRVTLRGGAVELTARVWIDEQDDVRLCLSGDFAFEGEIAYPGAFAPEAGDVTLLPMQEGMAFPVDDKEVVLPPDRPVYQGWFTSMQMWALIRESDYLVCAIDDSIDAMQRDSRNSDGRIQTQLSWVPEKGKWSYDRKMRYLVGQGDITGAAKAYRALMERKGMLVTLREKARTVPNLEKIMGAANCWMWNLDVRSVAQDMKAHGMDKVLWSHIEQKDTVSYLRDEIGWLVGRYDMYRDVANLEIQARFDEATKARPEIDRTYYTHCDAWPDDIVINADGSHGKCWVIRYPDGTSIPMEAMCGARYIKYAVDEVIRDKRERGYEARFVDTLPCTALDECYSPLHPTTRTTDANWRAATVQYMCDMGLVTGVEDMTDYLTPHVHYSEGLMSPGFYRQSEAGYEFQRVFSEEETPETILKFELNPAYRVPLFQLVFHDSVVSYWYWGDCDTNYPHLMPRRDAFNALYGTLPLYGATEKTWDSLKDRVYASYPRATKVQRLVGWDEMTGFEYLTPDKTVQRTTFSGGVTVTANLGSAPYTAPDGTVIAPDDYHVE